MEEINLASILSIVSMKEFKKQNGINLQVQFRAWAERATCLPWWQETRS